MNANEILETFRRTGALLSGHFLLTSGLHSDQYFQCAKVLQHPEIAESLCSQLGKDFQRHNPELVIAPAIGGIVVAQEVARSLHTRAIFAERVDGRMALRRGFEIKPGERTLVVEDVITTGGSVREVLELAIAEGAKPVGVGCLVDRSGGDVDFGFDMLSLMELRVDVMQPDNCRLCNQNLPLVKPGSREIK